MLKYKLELNLKEYFITWKCCVALTVHAKTLKATLDSSHGYLLLSHITLFLKSTLMKIACYSVMHIMVLQKKKQNGRVSEKRPNKTK